MSKQVVEQKTKALGSLAASADDVFGELHIDTSDILIPKILLMQLSSQLVGSERARVGEFVVSTSGKKVGSIAEPLTIIPFYNKKSWDVCDKDNNNKFLRNEPFTPENANLPWNDKEDGKNIKRYQRMDYFCLVPDMMKEGSVLPAVVSFKSTGYKTGNLIISEWADIRARNERAKQEGRVEDIKLPFSVSFILSGDKLQNQDKQTYCVPRLQVGVPVSEEHQRLCLEWLKTVKTAKNIVVDESEEDRAEETPKDVNAVKTDNVGKF